MRISQPGPQGQANAAPWRRWLLPAAVAASFLTPLALSSGASRGMPLTYTRFLADVGSGSVRTVTMAAYAVSKAALVHLTRVLDLELRPLGIRVNAVAPALIVNARNRPYLPPDLLAHAAAPEAVADIIVYLVSDAAALISGAVVPAYGA